MRRTLSCSGFAALTALVLPDDFIHFCLSSIKCLTDVLQMKMSSSSHIRRGDIDPHHKAFIRDSDTEEFGIQAVQQFRGPRSTYCLTIMGAIASSSLSQASADTRPEAHACQEGWSDGGMVLPSMSDGQGLISSSRFGNFDLECTCWPSSVNNSSGNRMRRTLGCVSFWCYRSV